MYFEVMRRWNCEVCEGTAIFSLHSPVPVQDVDLLCNHRGYVCKEDTIEEGRLYRNENQLLSIENLYKTTGLADPTELFRPKKSVRQCSVSNQL